MKWSDIRNVLVMTPDEAPPPAHRLMHPSSISVKQGKANSIATPLLHGQKWGVPQAAKALGLGQTRLREIIREGQIPVIRIMGKILILEQDLEDYLQGQYGTLRPTEARASKGLPPLPKFVRES
jgi:excisionase family DNA binding protein